jgi:WD40 repeat protein
LSFSSDEKNLASLGGQDDNTLVIWDIESGKAFIGNPVGMNIANKVCFFNTTSTKCLTIHSYGLRTWDLDLVQKKVKYTDILTNQIKRVFTCCVIDPTDQFAYIGTKTGDIMEINLQNNLFKRLGPNKKLFSQGVQSIKLLANGDLLLGAGDGMIAKVNSLDFHVKKFAKVMGAVTSLSLTADSTHFFCGTNKATIYWCNTDDIAPELRNTCHYEKINDVAFPHGYSELFATCSMNDIRVWNSKSRQELLRIEVPGLDCFCVFFSHDGKTVLSGWNDGKIRAFLPQSGKLLFAVNDAHNHGVTAIAATSDC